MKPKIFSDADRKQLLRIARESIHAGLHNKAYSPETPSPPLTLERGVFVTLKHRGELRGCLGRFESDGIPLARLIAVMAMESARHDFRFSPVALVELPEIDIQISVLTPLEPVKDISEIVIGEHGLQIRGRAGGGMHRSGTLLPQVASEHRWDVTTFLNATCTKAGLPQNAWKDPQTEIFKYGAEVFGDLDFAQPPFHVDE
ncbi:MAG: AmmeMemoRadiSam system protein A [Candidatus Omnitrophota bacterium]